jgi:hypothetical protein
LLLEEEEEVEDQKSKEHFVYREDGSVSICLRKWVNKFCCGQVPLFSERGVSKASCVDEKLMEGTWSGVEWADLTIAPSASLTKRDEYYSR